MIQEIYNHGPIACSVAVPDDMMNYTGGIYESKEKFTGTSHVVSVVGYGVEDGKKYWYLRNSWGTHWGINGFMKIIRGVNNILIESRCSWADPEDNWTEPKYHITTEEEKNDPRNKPLA